MFGEAGGEYEVDISEIVAWTDIPEPPLGFVDALSFLLIPFMDQIGFSTEGVRFGGNGYEVEFSRDDMKLKYCDFGRLDPPSLKLRTSVSGWVNYQAFIKEYANDVMPKLTDYVAVVRLIEATITLAVAKMERSKVVPKLKEITLGHESVRAKIVYTYPEWRISILANAEESRYFIGYPLSKLLPFLGTTAYNELSTEEVEDWKAGQLDVRDVSKTRIKRGMGKSRQGVKNVQSPGSGILKLFDSVFRIFR